MNPLARADHRTRLARVTRVRLRSSNWAMLPGVNAMRREIMIVSRESEPVRRRRFSRDVPRPLALPHGNRAIGLAIRQLNRIGWPGTTSWLSYVTVCCTEPDASIRRTLSPWLFRGIWLGCNTMITSLSAGIFCQSSATV